MRLVGLLLLLIAAGCAAPQVEPPSLAPRAAEAIDPRAPVPEAPISTEATPAVAERLDILVAQAVAGHQAFEPIAARAEQLVDAAGPTQSESWIVAQQALSAAIAARAPVARALGEVNAVAAERIAETGGIPAADLAAISATAARIAEIDSLEAALIERLRARLGD